MDDSTRSLIVYVVIPLVLGLGGFIMRSLFMRVDQLEREISDKVSDQKVREIIQDKVEPIRMDIQDVKSKIDKIYDFLLKK